MGDAAVEDGATADAGVPCPSARAEPFGVAASTPLDGSRLVHPDTEITIQLSEAVDPTTVVAANVRLRSTGLDVFGRPGVRAVVQWDAAKCAIVVTPTRPLPTASFVEVSVDGVASMEGDLLPATTVRFRTHEHARIESRFNDVSGTPFALSRSTLDGERRATVERYSDAAGADGTWGTSDDLVYGASSYTFGPNDEVERYAYIFAGPDMTFETGDDAVDFYEQRVPVDSNRVEIREFEDAGPDGVFFTDDDLLDAFRVYETNADGHEVYAIRWREPGVDGVYRTPDDVGQERTRTDVDDDGFRTTRFVFGAAGADMIWETDDDVPSQCQRFEYDDLGRLVVQDYSEPGADALCFGDDDVNRQREVSAFVGSTAQIVYVAPGADGTYESGDDVVFLNAVRDFDADGHWLGERRYQLGPDGMPFTEDDVQTARSVEAYAPNGLHAASIEYQRGPDAVFGTEDDVEIRRTSFDVGP